MVVFGVELITAEQIGKELGKSKSDVSKLIAKANLTAIPIKKKRYYSREQFVNYLKYGKIESRVLDLVQKVVVLEKQMQKEINRW